MIEHGDYVRSKRYGQVGRVHKFRTLGPEDAMWVKVQNPPLTEKEKEERFVGVLIHKSGSILIPESACEPIDPIVDFEHPYADKYFPIEEEAK